MSKTILTYLLDRTTVLLLCFSFAFGAASIWLGHIIVDVSPGYLFPVQLMSYLCIGFLISAAGYVVYRRVQYFVRAYTEKRLKSALERAEKTMMEAVSRVREEQMRSDKRLRTEFQQLVSESEQRCHEESLHRVFRFAVRSGACDGLFTHADLQAMSTRFNEYDALTVHWLLSTYDAFDVLRLTPRRKLATELRGLGYLSKSLEVFESVAELTKTDRDRTVLAYRREELDVYNGNYQSMLRGRSEPLARNHGHVLHVVARALPGVQSGYTLRTHYTAMAQLESGLKVSVVSQVGEAPATVTREMNTLAGIDYYTLPGGAKNARNWTEWLDANITELSSLVREIRPAVLHAHSDFFNATCAQVVGDYFDIPVVYESRGFWEESWLSRTEQSFGVDWEAMEAKWGLPEAYSLRKAREEEARFNASKVFTLAQVMKERIVSAGVNPELVSLVPNAVKSEEFPVLKRDKYLAESMDLQDGTVTIGYISSIVEYEGIDTLIDAYRIMSASSSIPVRLIIVGDGPVLPGLKKMVNDQNLRGVHFVGRVSHDDVLRYYSLIDIFVVPRRPSAVCHLVTPLKPFEAFSTGRTVVLSDVAALKEIASDSSAAELFVAGNARSLADVLSALITDPGRRAVLAERGAEWVRKERTWESNCSAYLQAYEDLGVWDC